MRPNKAELGDVNAEILGDVYAEAVRSLFQVSETTLKHCAEQHEQHDTT